MRKYRVEQTIHACVDEWGSWGNGNWVIGKIVNLVFCNGKPAYDVVEEPSGIIVHNILENTITVVK